MLGYCSSPPPALIGSAGVDWVPTRHLPPELPVAANTGGGAEPMSEHIVALALAAAKRLFIEHSKLKGVNSISAAPTECCGAGSAGYSALAMSGSRRRG